MVGSPKEDLLQMCHSPIIKNYFKGKFGKEDISTLPRLGSICKGSKCFIKVDKTGFSKYGIWELLRHVKVPEIHVLATLLTGNAWKKDLLNIG